MCVFGLGVGMNAGSTEAFKLTVAKRRAFVVVVEGWRIVSGAAIEAGESFTIVVEHVHCGSGFPIGWRKRNAPEARCGLHKFHRNLRRSNPFLLH
jgi:hypothetical protein